MSKHLSIRNQLKNPISIFIIRYILPFIFVGAITLLKQILPDPYSQSSALLFAVVIVIQGLIGGFKSAIFMAIVATIDRNYFFLSPIGRFKFEDSYSLSTTLGYLFQALFLGLTMVYLKVSREELEKSKKFFTKLMYSNVSGMVIANSAGTIKETNSYFLDLLGINREEFNMREVTFLNAFDEKSKVYLNNETLHIFESGAMPPTNLNMINKKNEIIPVTVSAVILSRASNLWLYILVDQSAARKIEKNKDDFVRIASHELKTPITILKGYLQLLNKKLLKQSDDYSSMLSMMDIQINKITDLINELHDMSKIEVEKLYVQKEKFDLVQMTKETITAVAPFIDKQNIKLETRLTKLEIMADQKRLEQVIVNLLTNAIKYSPSEANIIVKIEKIGKDAKVSVEDFGRGIEEDKIPFIFEKFYQVDSDASVGGLGLGLFISKQIVLKHKGQMQVESTLGKGSIFSFKIPLN